MNRVGTYFSIASGFRDQYFQELECIRGVGHNVIGDGFVNIIGVSNGDFLLAGVVSFQRTEAR